MWFLRPDAARRQSPALTPPLRVAARATRARPGQLVAALAERKHPRAGFNVGRTGHCRVRARPRLILQGVDSGRPGVQRRVNGWLAIFWVAMIPISYSLGWLKSVTYVSALSVGARLRPLVVLASRTSRGRPGTRNRTAEERSGRGKVVARWSRRRMSSPRWCRKRTNPPSPPTSRRTLCSRSSLWAAWAAEPGNRASVLSTHAPQQRNPGAGNPLASTDAPISQSSDRGSSASATSCAMPVFSTMTYSSWRSMTCSTSGEMWVGKTKKWLG